MKKSLLFVSIMLISIINCFGQPLSIDLTFSAINNATFVQLDSIKVLNKSQGGEHTIYYPDTTLSLEITPGELLLCIGYSTGYPTGFQEINRENSSFQLFQNYPNPVQDQCVVSMFIPREGKVSIMVNDIQGRLILSNEQLLNKGMHNFHFYPGNSSLYLLSAQWKDVIQHVKITNIGQNIGKQSRLDYAGIGNNDFSLKESLLQNDLVMIESGILDSPNANKTYTFQFATNIPCPGTPTVEYEGQVYNTIQIFSQCWLKENLNVGTMILESKGMTDNDTIEKYCYDNALDSCSKYGGLYQWNEMMQYSSDPGAQGICPPGWRVPTDDAWKVLEGAVDSYCGIGDYTWEVIGYRGYNAGANLKSTSGWYADGNGTDLFGFFGRPGGMNFYQYGFLDVDVCGIWWTSTEYNSLNSYYRYLQYDHTTSYRHGTYIEDGISVRCLRDY